MNVRIGKVFRWEMGHRLPYHSGGCENLHGHSYQLWVEVVGTIDPNGMVLDYYEIKKIVQPIIDHLDHSFLCTRSDTVLVEFFQNHPEFKVVYVDFYTTAENIARYFLELLYPRFVRYPNLQELRIRVSETEKTFAEVTASLVEPKQQHMEFPQKEQS